MRLVSMILAAVLAVLAPSLATAECPAAAGDGSIRSVHISGSSLEVRTLSQAFVHEIGKPDTDGARQAVAKAIAAIYAGSGVALYDVSLGSPAGCGAIDVSVVEGHVGSAVIRGKLSAAAQRSINRYIARIVAERPLHVSTLQRYVSLIRDIPGLKAKVEFEPTERRDEVRMVVTVSRSRAKAGFSIDNRGARLTGHTEFQLSASLYGTILSGDEIDAALFTTNSPARLLALSASYSAPIGGDGTRVSLSIARSRSTLVEYGYTSNTILSGVEISKPVIRNYDESLYVGLAVRKLSTHLGIVGYDLLNNDGYSLGPKASYERAVGDKSEIAVSVTSAFGRIHQSSAFVHLSPVRDMRRVTVRAIVYHQIASGWTLRVRGVAQIATHNLPTTDQLSLGGSEFGRAFANGFIAGDSGYAASGELALRLGGAKAVDHPSEAYVFVDGGRLSYRDPLSSARDPEALVSSGAGLRIGGEKASISFEAAAGSAHLFGLDKSYRRLSVGLQCNFS